MPLLERFLLPYERFLSGMAFSIYEIVRVAVSRVVGSFTSLRKC